MKVERNIYERLLGSLIKNGKKSIAKQILDESLRKSSLVLNVPIFQMTKKIFSRIDCRVMVKNVRRRKRVHIVPFPLKSNRQSFIKVNWLISSAKESNRAVSIEDKLSFEIVNLLKGTNSKVLKKKNFNNKIVSQNRSNIHYRW